MYEARSHGPVPCDYRPAIIYSVTALYSTVVATFILDDNIVSVPNENDSGTPLSVARCTLSQA